MKSLNSLPESIGWVLEETAEVNILHTSLEDFCCFSQIEERNLLMQKWVSLSKVIYLSWLQVNTLVLTRCLSVGQVITEAVSGINMLISVAIATLVSAMQYIGMMEQPALHCCIEELAREGSATRLTKNLLIANLKGHSIFILIVLGGLSDP